MRCALRLRGCPNVTRQRTDVSCAPRHPCDASSVGDFVQRRFTERPVNANAMALANHSIVVLTRRSVKRRCTKSFLELSRLQRVHAST